MAFRRARAEVHPNPSSAQIEAGNYRKGHVRLHGLDISIENGRGGIRKAKDGSWSRRMRDDYGYFLGTLGADGDHVDCFVGPHPESEAVFVVDQVKKDGTFDEVKVVLGARSLDEARRVYLRNYPIGWTGIGAITPATIGQLKRWLASDGVHRRFLPWARAAQIAKALGSGTTITKQEATPLEDGPNSA
ncbi:MAG TPA: hypothetical protein VMT89_02050, partial [Candidatus Acidoferrales bacterium]|nr:hypothetical protein [Candidatus Acidoferrales bacterium]